MSRIEDNSRILRSNLINKNIYTENNIYDINTPVSIQFINDISRLLRPGNGFDFSNTVIGRVIGPQTKLSNISSVALAKLYTEQVKSIIVRKNIPTINLNNLFTNNDIELSVIDFSITKENKEDIENNIFNILSDYSSIYNLKNPIELSTNNTTDISKILVNQYTGKGQLNNLRNLLSNNIYYNNFSNSIDVDNSSLINDITNNNTGLIFNNITGFRGISIDNSLDGYYRRRYSNQQYGSVVTPIELTYKIDTISNKDDSEDIVTINSQSENTFTWGLNNSSIDTDIGLLGYTNALFNSITTEGKPSKYDKTVDSIEVNGKRYYNGVKYANRSYSQSNQYNSLDKTIRPYGNNLINSVIKDRQIPKVIFNSPDSGNPINNSMFTIENLGFEFGTTSQTQLENIDQLGPNNGKLMWFVPSILDFSENVIPNIVSTNFLGRGEPVYTYANTERKLQLNFIMIADYAKEFINVNTLSDFANRIYGSEEPQNNPDRYSAPTNNFSNDGKINKLQQDAEQSKNKLNTITIDFDISDNLPIDFYYNDSSFSMVNIPQNNGFDEKLNTIFNKMNEYYSINSNAIFDININGSVFDTDSNLDTLYSRRVRLFKEYIEGYYLQNYPKLKDRIGINIEDFTNNNVPKNITDESLNSVSSIKKRKVSISSVVVDDNTNNIDQEITDFSNTIISDINNEIDDINSRINGRRIIINDDEISDSSINGTFNKIKQNKLQNGLITYTAFDIYERLTFLHQCTRQGRSPVDGNISNSAFGKPPIIVFKLGDMYNTKAIITSMDFQFEQEIPWDLNPEGFGVQKMGCKVNINMNLIGASGINGPKSHILNGNSKRFYANSSFESQSDIIDDEDNILNN